MLVEIQLVHTKWTIQNTLNVMFIKALDDLFRLDFKLQLAITFYFSFM